MIADIVMALGLVFVIEGLLYALVPGQLKQMLLALLKLSDDQLRMTGLIAVTVGVAIVWLVKSVSG